MNDFMDRPSQYSQPFLKQMWAENEDNHSSQTALTIAGNMDPNNRAYNSFLGASELSTLSLATMEVKSFGDVRDIQVQPYFNVLQCLKTVLSLCLYHSKSQNFKHYYKQSKQKDFIYLCSFQKLIVIYYFKISYS